MIMQRPTARRSARSAHLIEVDGQVMGAVLLADSFLLRLRGMLWRRTLPEALLLLPGGSVHGMGMTVPLDVAMLVDGPSAQPRSAPLPRELRPMVVAKTARLRPFSVVTAGRGTRAVLELPMGGLARWGVTTGSVVRLVSTQA